MLRFRYTATDKDGLTVSGELDAESRDSAAARLEAGGLHPERIDAIEDEAAPLLVEDVDAADSNVKPVAKHSTDAAMSPSDLHQVTNHIANVTESALPLASGLLAISEEVSSRHLKGILANLSRRLEAGESLDVVLQNSTNAIPTHLNELLRASLRTGNLGPMIEQYVTLTRENVEIRRKVWLGLAYPLLVLFAACLVTIAIFTWVVPQFGDIYNDFGVMLPDLTVVIIALSHFFRYYAIWVLPLVVIAAVAVWFSFQWLEAQALRQRLISKIPIIGTLSHLASMAQFCQLLAMLIESQVPLPEALRIAAAGTYDGNLSEGCQLLADEVEDGVSLSEAAQGMQQFPPSMVNIFRWERHPGAFSDALYAAGEIFSARTHVQTNLIAVVCEPAAIIFVAVLIGTIVLALFMPLINLLGGLS